MDFDGPVNRFAHLRNRYHLEQEDVDAVIETLLSLTDDGLMKVARGDRNPDSGEKPTVLETSYAKAIMFSKKKGNLAAVETLLSRKLGNTKIKIDSNNLHAFQGLTDAELEAMIAKGSDGGSSVTN